MKIMVARAAAKALKRLPRNQAERIMAAIGKLPMGDVKRLQGRPEYRLRVGSWRVIFAMDAETITVTAIGPRGDIYR
jgi:mRNA interferase RelE/StbE